METRRNSKTTRECGENQISSQATTSYWYVSSLAAATGLRSQDTFRRSFLSDCKKGRPPQGAVSPERLGQASSYVRCKNNHYCPRPHPVDFRTK
jgi:hypothetical protein